MIRARLVDIILLILAIALAGCVTREGVYEDVAASRQASYQGWFKTQEKEAKSQEKLSGTLSLADALDLALIHNRDIQSAVEGQIVGKGRVWEGYSEALPKLTGTASYRRLDRTPATSTPPTTLTIGKPPDTTTLTIAGSTIVLGSKDNYSVNFVLSQPIFHGGQIIASINSGLIFSFITDEQLRATVDQVIYAAAHAYFDALLAKKLYDVDLEALNSAEAHLKDVLKRKEAGVATQIDVLRAQVEVANTRADMIRQDDSKKLGIASLLRIMGVSQQSDVTLSEELEYRPIRPALEAAVKSAYEKRPDVYLAELDVRIQEEAVRLARSKYFPFVDASFTQLWAKPDPNNTSHIDWGRQWFAGIGATWFIFDGFRREAQILEAKAILRQTQIRLADTEQRAQLEVTQALTSLRDAEEQIEAQKSNVERAREGLRLAMVGYPEVTTEVEVTDARAALVRAEGVRWQAIYAHQIARLDLQKAMGLLSPAPRSQQVPPTAPKPGDIPEFMGTGPSPAVPRSETDGTRGD